MANRLNPRSLKKCYKSKGLCVISIDTILNEANADTTNIDSMQKYSPKMYLKDFLLSVNARLYKALVYYANTLGYDIVYLSYSKGLYYYDSIIDTDSLLNTESYINKVVTDLDMLKIHNSIQALHILRETMNQNVSKILFLATDIDYYAYTLYKLRNEGYRIYSPIAGIEGIENIITYLDYIIFKR